jgi:hypothetical protein
MPKQAITAAGQHVKHYRKKALDVERGLETHAQDLRCQNNI